MDTNNNFKEIQKYIELFESFLVKFIKGDSISGRFLKTEDNAQLKRVVLEVLDFLTELFGENNTFSLNILNTLNTPTVMGSPSYASVKDVIAILQAATTKLKRTGIKIKSTISSTSSQIPSVNEFQGNVETDFWEEGHFRLFASHLAKDKDNATLLQSELNHYNISTFVAHKDITPTKEWQEEIELALKTAEALIALLTPGFHESFWTDQEVGFAMGQDILAVAIILGEEPYGFIAKLQSFQGKNKTMKELANEIFKVFLLNKQTKKGMAYALLNRFESSNSYAEAQNNMSLLEKIEYWESQFEERIRNALHSNRQISKAYDVPYSADTLISKWTKL